MENVSHSLPKRSFSISATSNGGFASHKSVYDDVFGGPPKFGIPTLAPRLEDYSEIFGGFHAARSSSIPLLHLPLNPPESDELHFDVDYGEVFGGFGGGGFTASFEDLVGESSGGYESSEEPWSPAQSGSLSDELDPLAGSDKSQRLSDGYVHQSPESTHQFNVSYNKSSQRNMQTVYAGTTQMTNFSAIPGYTSSHCESPASWSGEDDGGSMPVADDTNPIKEFGRRVPEDKQHNKSSSNPLHSVLHMQGNSCNLLKKDGSSTSPRDKKPFITVSDISLRTKPSRLPPPSRPPPALVLRKTGCERLNSKLKPSKSYAFERVANDSAPLSFDAEVDATVSADIRENGNKNVEVKHESMKKSIEKKDIQSHSSMQMEENTNKFSRVSSSVEDEKMLQSHGKEATVAEPVIEDRTGFTNTAYDCAEAVAWRDETEYFEVVGNNIFRQDFDAGENCDSLMQQMSRDAYKHYNSFDHKKDNNKFKATKEVSRWDEERNQSEMTEELYDWGDKLQKEMLKTRLSDRQGFQEKVMLNKLASQHDSDTVLPQNYEQLGDIDDLRIDPSETVEGWLEANGHMSEVKAIPKLKGSPKGMDIEKSFIEAQLMKQNSEKHKQNSLREECQSRLEDVDKAETRERVTDRIQSEGNKKQTENKQKETHKLKENGMFIKEAKMHGDSRKKSSIASGHEKGADEQLVFELEKDNKMLVETGKHKVIELAFGEAFEQVGTDGEYKMVHGRVVVKERNGGTSKTEENDLKFELTETEPGITGEVSEAEGNMHFSGDAGVQEKLTVHVEGTELENGHIREVKWNLDDDVLIEGEQLKAFDGEGITSKVLGKHDNIQSRAAFSSEVNGVLKAETNSSSYGAEAGIGDTLVQGNFNGFAKNRDEFQDNDSVTNKSVESPSLPKQMTDSNKASSAPRCSHEPEMMMSNDDDGVQNMKGTQFISKRGDASDSFTQGQVLRESLLNGRKVEDASSGLKRNDDALHSTKNATNQRIERTDKNMKGTFDAKDQKAGERIRRESKLENEEMRRIEEEREREREREKDRMAVDKAALEARERSYAEARERAERAAVERATAEVRQRAIAGARERLEKASVEARLRAERAAVERATAEARQRAAEKLMAHGAAYDAHEHVERSAPDRFSASFRSADTRQSSLSSDLHFQSAGISNGLRYSYPSAQVGAEGESPQRCKARLERYRRTAERAANALAEKNRRDLLAQREREERNRVAEVLDAEVKRWSSGKEGNLRALLSTLQYILGPDSGWHPVPLTEVITSAAVKKAYRKATLCVHPDKLQQRGATIHQKYICEKVFDLLKEAWNKFNSEER